MENKGEVYEQADCSKSAGQPEICANGPAKIVAGLVFFSGDVCRVCGLYFIHRHWFAKPVSEGSIITWGIYVGLFVILFAIAITGIYVYLANGKFEKMTQEVVKDVMGVEK